MSVDRILQLKLISDVGDINKDTKALQGRLKGLASSAKSWGAAWGKSLAIDGISKLGDALRDGIEGFKSGRIVTDQLATTWRNLGMDGDKLSATLQKVTDSTLALGTSDDEAVAAFTQSIKFTRDYEKSLDHLQIAQDLVANGSAPNLESAFKIIQQASKGSARVVDRFGLDAKTADGRVRQLGRGVKGAAKNAAALDPMAVSMNEIGEAFETIAGSLIVPVLDEAGKLMRDVVAPGVTDLANALSDGELAAQLGVLTAAVALLGVAAYAHPIIALTVGLAAFSAVAYLAVKDDWLGQLADQATSARDRIAAGDPVDLLDRGLLALDGTIHALLDPFAAFFDNIATAWRGAQEIIAGDFSNLGVTLGAVASLAAALILLPFQVTWGLIEAGFDQLGIDIVTPIRQGIRTVQQLIEGMVRSIVLAWNSLDFGIPAGEFVFAEAFQGEILGHKFGWDRVAFKWKGTGDLIPDFGHDWGSVATKGGAAYGVKPRLTRNGKGKVTGVGYADGLWDVPEDDFAFLHRGEQIVPADYADEFRRNGGTGGGTYITVNLSGVITNPAETGRQVAESIRAYVQRGGTVVIR